MASSNARRLTTLRSSGTQRTEARPFSNSQSLHGGNEAKRGSAVVLDAGLCKCVSPDLSHEGERVLERMELELEVISLWLASTTPFEFRTNTPCVPTPRRIASRVV